MISRPLVILGGTFDPPHLGHLQLMVRLQQFWPAPIELVLLPTYQPVHKAEAKASVAQRVEMLQFFANLVDACLDLREVQAERPCFTIDSLRQIRAEQGSLRPLIFVMGGDSFAQLHLWQDYQSLLSLAHLLWFPRAGQSQIGGPQKHWPVAQPCQSLSCAQGLLLHLSFCPSAIASSHLRRQPDLGRFWVPEPIYHYYQQHRIYA